MVSKRALRATCVAALILSASLGLVERAPAADTQPGAAALSAEQEALAQELDGRLIAPCCWTQTVAVHESDAASQIKAQVRMLVAQGQGRDEILDSFVAQYGGKILAAPRARGFGSILYVGPVVGVAVAAILVGLLLVRWRRPGRPASLTPAPEAIAAADELHSRMRRELADFDR